MINDIVSVTTTQLSSNIEDVEKYVSLLDTYGAATVIVAIFIVVLLFVLVVFIKLLQNSNKQIMNQQQELLNKLIENSNNLKKPQKEKNIIELFVKIDDSMKDILGTIRDKLNADRVSIYVFHNGVYSSHGLPFFKTTCVSEVIKKGSGVSRKSKSHNALPLSMFDTSIKALYIDGQVIIKNIKEIKTKYPVIHNMLDSTRIVSGAAIAIYDNNDNILGVLISEFISEVDNMEEVINCLQNEAIHIAPILEYSDFQN